MIGRGQATAGRIEVEELAVSFLSSVE